MTENNNNSNNLNGKDFILGAVVGGLLGALTALVLAPKSGRELRDDISGQYHQVVDKTQQLAVSANEKGQEIVKNISAQTSELVGKAKEVASTVAEEVKALRVSSNEAACSAEESNTEVAAEAETTEETAQ